ncbi:MAG: MOSC domain-containing protein [Acidimicrobiales bacterium]
MKVEQLWRYPVKSMMGERQATGAVGALGLAGDRGWAVRDEERGGIRGAKKIAALMQLSARYVDEPDGVVEITLPDGSSLTSDDPDRDERLSAALDHRVTLWPRRPATDLDHYRRGQADHEDIIDELRSIFGREADEPLPDLGAFPPEVIEFESPPGSYVDAYPLMVMSTSALRSLEDALPESDIDVRRFRPNLVIDTGGRTGHPELEWAGMRARIGSATIELTTPCPRCVMVSRAIDADLPADRSILRHIVRDLDQNVGMYATVVDAGAISEGDSVLLM